MAVKWSTPGIGFSEVDNSIRSNAAMSYGVGAIVLKSNKGYPNQRIYNTSRAIFHQNFGDQENASAYGHFAADQFLAVSPNLYAVRATMGDEEYAFIQYPYTDAALQDCNSVAQIQRFEYVDKEGSTNIVMLDKPIQEENGLQKLTQQWQASHADTMNSGFAYVAPGRRYYVEDVFTNAQQIVIARDTSAASAQTASGMYYEYSTGVNGSNTELAALNIKGSTISFSGVNVNAKIPANLPTYMVSDAIERYTLADGRVVTFSGVNFSVPSTSALNAQANNVTVMCSGTLPATIDIANIKNYMGEGAANTPVQISKVRIEDWDNDAEYNDYYVNTSAYVKGLLDEDNNVTVSSNLPVSGIMFREITGALYTQDLAIGAVSVTPTMDLTTDDLFDLAANYGISNPADIQTSAYMMLSYTPAYPDFDGKNETRKALIYTNNPRGDEDLNLDNNSAVYTCSSVFVCYNETLKNGKTQTVTKSCYVNFEPAAIIEPTTVGTTKENMVVAPMRARSTSEILSDPSGKYRDGYTPTILTEDEPGNGDIESYSSNQANQLVIAAYGPGEFGNDIGVSIITPAVAGNQALEGHQNAFNWKYQFDDEDQVDKDWMENPTYLSNPYNLTWKKVYRINVYVKTKTQQASVWGTGLDALVRDPVESWLVSNDPSAKDSSGNSMYAPYVINGNSKYIYVSLTHTSDARTAWGSYAMPKQTYSIYQLQGGKNGVLDNIKEKTAALELYRDRQAAPFDILFNVDPIESFQSRQRYAAHQNKIAEIAAERMIDIGIIQTSSKKAKTGTLALSEGKNFKFANGSYVAPMVGYDRYFDGYTSNWVYLPKSVAMAIAHAYCWRLGTPWMAPAGIQRGVIDYSNGQICKFTDNEIGQLYDNNLNTSRTCAGYGEVLWGQKTALKKESALNRINVRGLLNYIEKNLDAMLLPYLYQNNTSSTRQSMLSTVDSFLSEIMAKDGIISKSVQVIPDPVDTHLVYVKLTIVPAETIERIEVVTTINRQSGTVSSEESFK